MIPFGEFAPDQSPSLEILTGGRNVYAKPDKTYAPVASFMNAITALAQRCQGAFFSTAASGSINLWTGTAAKLYQLSGGAAFTDVSKVGGYTCAANEFWEFCQFGQRVIANNFADPVQAFVLNSSALFADLSAGAPKARHSGVVANFLLLGNTNDGVFGAQPDGLWWSALGDPTNFPTVATSAAAAVQSGRINISGNGGWVQKIVPRVGTLDGIVVQERQITRIIYIGTPDVLAFQPMEGARGSPSPGSVVRFGGFMIYLGEDGYYLNDGTQSIPIGAAKIDKYFYTDVNQNKLDRVCAVIDPINKLYIVGYPSNASSGNPDKMLMYSWAAQRWSPPTYVDFEFLTTMGSVGYTLEGLAAFGDLDHLPASLDSRIWSGNGKPVLAAFDTSHRLGYFTGASMAAELETGDADGLGRRFLTRGIRPLVDGGANATIKAKIGYREDKNTATPAQYTSPTVRARDGKVPVRVSTRYPRVWVGIDAGVDWSHANGFELDMVDAGSM